MDKPRINEQIKSPEVRVIGPEGENLGNLSAAEALRKAKELGLDLIEISAKTSPPVVKIADYGKYLYSIEKKAKKIKKIGQEIKGVRISLGISQHDLEMKAKKISDFLKKGERIRLELFLPGRTKYFNKEFLNERLERILNFVTIPYKKPEPPRKTPRGIGIIIEPESKSR